MKVKPSANTKNLQKSKAMSKEELRDRIQAKFGKDVMKKKPVKKIEEKVTIETKSPSEQIVGDNDPSNQLTHDKLRSVLKSGAVKFSDRERRTLAKILK